MAEATRHIIEYISDISDVRRKALEIQRINKLAADRLGKDFTGAVSIVSRQLERIRTTPINIDGQQATQTVSTFATVVKDAEGNLFTLRENVTRVDGAFKNVNSTFTQGARTTRTLGDNFKTLLSRAALTIPVWFAIRNSIGLLFGTIRDGLRDISDFDSALQKLGRNISATSDNFEADFRNIQNAIQEFSVESGRSVQEITRAIQRFATVGFDIETALTGGIQATKLAITLFGDAEETANAFARSLRVLTADLASAEDQQRAITEALALTDQLWQTNAFEVSEFSNNLEKFAGTARIANLSIEDTLTLLATLSTAGLSNRAGRLLRSTLLRSLADFENINRELSLGLDPNETPTIDFVLSLVQALQELKTAENIPVGLADTLGDLFTVRGTEVLAALTSLEGILRENIALRPDVEKFEQTFEDLNQEISRLNDQFDNLNKEIGRSFTTGLVGGEDYRTLLQSIVNIQRDLLEDSERLGGIFRNAFIVAGIGSLVAFRRQLLGLITTLARNRIVLGATAGFVVLDFKEQANQLERDAVAANQRFVDIGAEIATNINKGFRQQLSADELSNLISEIETIGANQLGFDEATLARAQERLEIELQIARAKEEQTEATRQQAQLSTIPEDAAEILLQDTLDRLRAEGALESELIKQELLTRQRLGNELKGVELLERQLSLERALNEERRIGEGVSSRAVQLFRIAQESGVDTARTISDVLSGDVDFSTFVRRGGEAVDVFRKEFADVFEAEQARRFFQGLTTPGVNIRGGTGFNIAPTAQRFDVGLESRISRALQDLRPIETNTTALREVNVSLESLIQTFQAGGRLEGLQAQRFVDFEASRQQNIANVAQRVAPGRQILDVNVNIDGQSLGFSGTPEAIRTLARQLSPAVQQAVEQSIISQIETNPNSNISQAIDTRIEEF